MCGRCSGHDGTMDQNRTAFETAAEEPLSVPEFRWFDAELAGLSRQQESFYRSIFLPSLFAGTPVDVQGQSGYGAVLLEELRAERRETPIESRQTLEALVSAYTGADRPAGAMSTLADFYFLEGNFAAGYETLGAQVQPELHLTLAAHLGNPRLTAEQIWRWSEGGITQKGYKYLGAIFRSIQAQLDAFHDSQGESILVDFWRRVTVDKPVEQVAIDIEDEVLPHLTGEEVRYFLQKACEAKLKPAAVQPSNEEVEETIAWPSPWVAFSHHLGLLRPLFRKLTRDAENAVRDEAGVPRVGEGWVSEMTLLREIQAAFPDVRVIHQAKPGWLAPQSLDIYLPDYKIGIEYQGVQHSKPVEHFGGSDAFERQQARDAMKWGLCEENGCVLIEVHPGYKREDVLAQVKEAILSVARDSQE